MNSNIDNSILPMMNNGYVDFSIDKSLSMEIILNQQFLLLILIIISNRDQ